MTWNHLICDHCWHERMKAVGTPEREPVRMRIRGAQPERCCFCGVVTTSGIWVRHDPRMLSCTHPAEA